jgi:hypothetical protein
MNAKEARKKALEITGETEKKNYAEIKQKIALAVDRGELSCHYYKTIMPAVRIKLVEEGYKITSAFDQREGTTVTIDW